MPLISLMGFCAENRLQADRSDNFQYAAALGALGAATGNHRLAIGGFQIVLWSDDPQGDGFLDAGLRVVSDDGGDRHAAEVEAWRDRLNADDSRLRHVLGLEQGEGSPIIRFWITDSRRGPYQQRQTLADP